MHAYTVQLPSTFVSDFRGRTKFLLLERNNTGSSFLDSCFVRIWPNPLWILTIPPLQLGMEEYAWAL